MLYFTRLGDALLFRVALGIGLGGVFGSIFWKLSLQESSIQNRVSLFVNVAMNTAMFGCIRALQTLAVERGVVALERMDEASLFAVAVPFLLWPLSCSRA